MGASECKMSEGMPKEAVSVLRLTHDDGADQLRRVRSALKKLDGVREVKFDYIQSHVQVKYDPAKVDESALKKAISA